MKKWTYGKWLDAQAIIAFIVIWKSNPEMNTSLDEITLANKTNNQNNIGEILRIRLLAPDAEK